MKLRTLLCLSALGLAIGAPACGNDVERVGWTPATLSRAQSCDDLLTQLREDALYKMNATIDAAIERLHQRNDYLETPAMDGAETGDGSGGSSASGGNQGNPEHSETNTQVEGVDEADIVKTDGNYIYTLHGGRLAILDSYPAAELALASTTTIEGYGLEMFVTDTHIVIYSAVDGSSVYTLAGLSPRPDPWGSYGPSYAPLTKVTVLGHDGPTTTLEQEYYFEGSYNSARRVDNHVRTVVSGGWGIPPFRTYPSYGEAYPEDDGEWEDWYENVRDQNTAAIEASTLEDWVARRFVRHGAQLEVLPPVCEAHYLPTIGTTQYGLTQLLSFDLDDPSGALSEAQILGAVQTIYSTADAMYLAGQVWPDPMWQTELDDEPLSLTATHVHKFDLGTNPSVPAYVASGSVPGTLHNQFSLDEHDGLLRVATTDSQSALDFTERVNNVFVLRRNLAGLELVAEVAGIAPGETIQSARFVGDRGYVVTFRQVDPLFVLDLATPEAPAVVAEIAIPGFSEYMHPIEDGQYLLTIGRDGSATGVNGDMALQIFDVRNAAAPTLAHKEVLPGGWSEAEENHKAFTFYQGMLAIPFTRYDSYGWQSTLELFSIDVTQGISPLGTIDHTPFFGDVSELGYDYCGGSYYFGVGVRRGVFIEQTAYAISYGGVTAHPIANLSETTASVPLPELGASDCPYYGYYY